MQIIHYTYCKDILIMNAFFVPVFEMNTSNSMVFPLSFHSVNLNSDKKNAKGKKQLFKITVSK